MEAFRDDFLSLLCNILITRNSSCQSKLGLADSSGAPNQLGWGRATSPDPAPAEVQGRRGHISLSEGTEGPPCSRFSLQSFSFPGFALHLCQWPCRAFRGTLLRSPRSCLSTDSFAGCRLFARRPPGAQPWALAALRYHRQLITTTQRFVAAGGRCGAQERQHSLLPY